MTARSSGARTDLRPLLQCPTLKKLTVPYGARDVQALRALTALSYRYNTAPQTVEQFWKRLDEQRWLVALSEVGYTPRRTTLQFRDGAWCLVLTDPPAGDLSILRGASVTSLAGLRDLPLKMLTLWDTTVTDLAPLKGLPIERVILRNSRIADLSPLRGMALRQLTMIDYPEITDLSAMSEMKALTCVALPKNAHDYDFLRTFPKLDRVRYEWDLQAN